MGSVAGVNVTGKRVVILGDSLSVGPRSLGGYLEAGLVDRGADVRVDARVSRSASSFFRLEPAPDILAELAAFRPHIVLIQLGTNALGRNLEVESARLGRIAAAFPGAEVWALGPPALRRRAEAAEVAAMMRRRFPRFIDVRRLSSTQRGRTADRVHFTAAGARAVAGQVLAKLTARPARAGSRVISRGTVKRRSLWVPVALVAVVGTSFYMIGRQ